MAHMYTFSVVIPRVCGLCTDAMRFLLQVVAGRCELCADYPIMMAGRDGRCDANAIHGFWALGTVGHWICLVELCGRVQCMCDIIRV